MKLAFSIALILAASTADAKPAAGHGPLIMTTEDEIIQIEREFRSKCQRNMMLPIDVEKLGSTSLSARPVVVYAWKFPLRTRSGWRADLFAGIVESSGTKQIRLSHNGITETIKFRDYQTIEICAR